MSLLIENGNVYTEKGLIRRDILIEDGKIERILDKHVNADRIIKARGKMILPGLIDPHVHFRDPGLTHKEDFLTGSRAAAAGGVTTVLDMPNTKPPTLSEKLLDEKRKLARKKSVVNFGFHFGSSTDNIKEILRVNGVASVKIFMDATTGNMLISDPMLIKNVMEASDFNTVHAEAGNVGEAIRIAESLRKKFYLCHVSSKAELEFVERNRKQNVCVEVTPHHLFFTAKDIDNFIHMRPLPRKDSDRKALWDALSSGLIDTIGTDHAPHTLEEKRSDNPPYGVPGVETRLPLMLDAVNKRKLTIERLVQLVCENPAKIFKLRNKGFIKEGFDADLTIVDMKMKQKVRNDRLFTKCGWSPFEGYELKGWPVTTIVNGNIVFENGEVEDKAKGKEVECG